MPDKLVAAMDGMSDEIVVKHFNARHARIGGMARSLDNMSPGVVATLRQYHARVHRLGVEGDIGERVDINHTHRDEV